MKRMLYAIVELISRAHSYILKLNDKFEYNFSDKQLHLIVIGLIGMLLVFVVHPLFTKLAKSDHVIVITWIYVFTLIVGLTFAIEIGQGITHTGVMEFADIMFGVYGFVLMFAIFACVRWIVKAIIKILNNK